MDYQKHNTGLDLYKYFFIWYNFICKGGNNINKIQFEYLLIMRERRKGFEFK